MLPAGSSLNQGKKQEPEDIFCPAFCMEEAFCQQKDVDREGNAADGSPDIEGGPAFGKQDQADMIRKHAQGSYDFERAAVKAFLF